MIRPTKRERRRLAAENLNQRRELQRMTAPPGVRSPPGQIEVWRSRDFLVQIFDDGQPGILRMTVCRTKHSGNNWHDNITWDELQALKHECGHGDLDAVEVYPRDRDVVNVANMRHLFIFAAPLPFAWRSR
jgi:hypothetical protein